jgi:hypothetical protein
MKFKSSEGKHRKESGWRKEFRKKNRMRRNKNRRKWVGTGGVWEQDKTLGRLGSLFSNDKRGDR